MATAQRSRRALSSRLKPTAATYESSVASSKPTGAKSCWGNRNTGAALAGLGESSASGLFSPDAFASSVCLGLASLDSSAGSDDALGGGLLDDSMASKSSSLVVSLSICADLSMPFKRCSYTLIAVSSSLAFSSSIDLVLPRVSWPNLFKLSRNSEIFPSTPLKLSFMLSLKPEMLSRKLVTLTSTSMAAILAFKSSNFP